MLVCDNGSNPLENYDELAKEYFKYFYSTMTAPMTNLFMHLNKIKIIQKYLIQVKEVKLENNFISGFR